MIIKTSKYIKVAALNGAALPQKFVDDKSGVAAIEFALIAPIMIAFYIGLAEISIGISVARDVSRAASVAGDLATQVTEMGRSEIADVMTAALAVADIDRTNVSRMSVELSSFRKTGTTISRVGFARMGPAIGGGGFNPASLGNNLLSTTSGVVVARVSYAYRPRTDVFLKNYTMRETFILKPRKSVSVPFEEGTQTSFTCTASAGMTVSCS